MKRLTLNMVVLLTVLYCVTAVAQAQQQSAPVAQGQQVAGGVLVKAEDLKGSHVIDPNGKRLGKVDSIVLDIANRKISYVSVDPGRGGKLIPVPIEMFGATRERQLVLNVNEKTLTSAPGYAKREKPNWVNERWARQVSDYWGAVPSGTSAKAPSAAQPATMGSSTQPQGGNQQQMGQQPAGNQGQPQPMGSGGQTR